MVTGEFFNGWPHSFTPNEMKRQICMRKVLPKHRQNSECVEIRLYVINGKITNTAEDRCAAITKEVIRIVSRKRGHVCLVRAPKTFCVTGRRNTMSSSIDSHRRLSPHSTRYRIEREIDKVWVNLQNCQDRLAPIRKFQCFNVYMLISGFACARQQREFYNSMTYGAHPNRQVLLLTKAPYISYPQNRWGRTSHASILQKRFHDFEFGSTCFLQIEYSKGFWKALDI